MFISQRLFLLSSVVGAAMVSSSYADPFFFSTGDPDGRMATASRPAGNGKIEIESADDFVLSQPTSLTSASFMGLLPTGFNLNSVGDVTVEIYRVFPNDSDVGRTSGSPTFSTPEVPTRVNSPSDVEFTDRSAGGSTLSFTASIVNSTFTAANSVLNGINPKPNVQTGGDGAATGEEVRFDVQFTTPIDLSDGHYFFVPQVELANGDFLWLSAPKPIVPPGTPFPPGSTDLQSWVRNEDLAPDWLRVGTDIVGGVSPPTFNAAFTLSGETVPTVPDAGSTLALFGLALTAIGAIERRGRNGK